MNDDDLELFLQEMRSVKPLSQVRIDKNNKRSLMKDESKKNARSNAESFEVAAESMFVLSEVPQVEPLEFLEWKQVGVQNAVFDKLKRGSYAIEGELDLHRKFVEEASKAVWEFLKKASVAGWRCVLISHGKGEKSPTPARLKSFLARWLVDHPEVIAYSSAQRFHGGVGALYVLLRKSDLEKETNRERHGLKSEYGSDEAFLTNKDKL